MHDDPRLTRPATLRTLEIGEHRITYLPDGSARLQHRTWLPGATDEVWDEFAPLIDHEGYLTASIGALLVQHGERAMLIDTGLGPHDIETPYGSMRGGQLPHSLRATGLRPDDIELIALTHLHLDHIGWLAHAPIPDSTTTLFGGIPVLVEQAEWNRRHDATADGVTPEILDAFAPQIRPLPENGEIFPGVRPFPTPGHSPGHTSYEIASGGQRLLAFGDAFTTPAQVTHPGLITVIDDYPLRTRITALTLIEALTKPDTLGFGTHFADVQFGSVARTNGRAAWQPS